MPRVQENAPGIRPSRSISRGSRISTITTSSLCAALMESTALTVSICALASSIRALMPRWIVWGIDRTFGLPQARPAPSPLGRDERSSLLEGWGEGLQPIFGASPLTRRYAPTSPDRRGEAVLVAIPVFNFTLPHQFLHRPFKTFDRDREHALRKQPPDDGGGF